MSETIMESTRQRTKETTNQRNNESRIGIVRYLNLPSKQWNVQALADQFNTDEEEWRKLEKRLRCLRKKGKDESTKDRKRKVVLAK